MLQQQNWGSDKNYAKRICYFNSKKVLPYLLDLDEVVDDANKDDNSDNTIILPGRIWCHIVVKLSQVLTRSPGGVS